MAVNSQQFACRAVAGRVAPEREVRWQTSSFVCKLAKPLTPSDISYLLIESSGLLQLFELIAWFVPFHWSQAFWRAIGGLVDLYARSVLISTEFFEESRILFLIQKSTKSTEFTTTQGGRVEKMNFKNSYFEVPFGGTRGPLVCDLASSDETVVLKRGRILSYVLSTGLSGMSLEFFN
jgi:hypothetical protein